MRRFLNTLVLSAAMGVTSVAMAAAPVVEVYKTEYCGCCKQWVKHLEANGFVVKAHDVEDPSDFRAKFGMADKFQSCHSAKVNGYALEGHVPASEIKRLLTEKPKAVGLAVPGMPAGSPGMEGSRSDAYDVLLVQPNGAHTVYKRYDAK
ncbi:MAG TPA: DUF411 domain-containing protein [Telluria sp.]|nr:DUF411 domain-containing protein [Telluria sp.]